MSPALGQAVTARLWYPQLDAYDAVRRMGMVASKFRHASLSKERLFILDFYLATPELLHKASLPAAVREALRALRLRRPENCFVSLPSPPLLFQKMTEVQTVALKTMIAKGLLVRELAQSGSIELTDAGRALFARQLSSFAGVDELRIADFLVEHLALIGESDIADLRRRTGLKRVGT